MALEFNADKQIIKSDQLQINNDTSVRFDIGGAANKKTAIFGTLSADIEKLVRVGINTKEPQFELDVNGQIRTTTSIISDTARINNLDIDTIVNPSLKLKAPILETFTDPDTGEVLFPRSASPAFDDDSNKIATTNFVYNIATNDLGGRIYVSKQIGNDSFDGRSATKPVSTIKRATQLAALTNDKETLIVAGGDYLEDNPISLPDQCSVVGDNIRLCIIRPQNPGKHMFKASNENYVTGITFRDNLNVEGNPAFTWGYAYVFDDKQRFYYPKTLGGQFGRDFELGHKIAAPEEWKLFFDANNGNLELVVGLTVTNATTLGTGVITDVVFNDNTDQAGYVIINEITGDINSVGAIYNYTVNSITYNLNVTSAEQLTPDAQVVKHVTTHTTFGLKSVQHDPINYPDGLIFEVVDPFYHDYEVGQYVNISNLPSTGTFGDLNRYNGRQYVSHRIETNDGFSKKFVVYKDTPTDLAGLGAVNGQYSVTAFGATVVSDDHYVVFSLDNSPKKFDESNKSPNRYLDAVDLIGRNKTPITEEAFRRVKEEYPTLVIPDEAQCKTDMGHIVDAINYDLTWGGNAATKEAADYYYDAGALTHVQNQLKETSYAFAEARDLSIQAMRNQLNTVSTSSTASIQRPTGYTGQYRSVIWDNEKFVAVGDGGAIHTSTDGVLWTAQTTGTTEDLNDIRWNKWAVGERGVPEYVVVGDNGTILWSSNAETWYSVTSGTTNNLEAIAYNGERYVAVGSLGTAVFSNNVKTWSTGTTGTFTLLHDLIYNDDCDKFVAVGGGGVIIVSSDGNTWTEQESGTSRELTAISWSEGRMVVTGADATVIISDDDGLTWETNLINNNSPDNPQSNKDADAADLILANQAIIAEIAVNKMLDNNAGYSIPTGNQACKDDIMAFIGAMAINLEFGNNDEVYDAANLYVTGSHVQGEEDESVEAFNYARDLCISAMRNEAFSAGDLTFASGLTQYIDNTVTTDTSTPLCATQASAITTFFGILTTAIGATGAPGSLSGVTRTPAADEGFTGKANRYWDASDLILENKKLIAAQAVYQYTDANSFTVPTGNQNCVDDVVDILEAIAHDLRHGGNAKTYDAADYYTGTSHVDGEEAETVAIINIARDLAITAMRNTSITLSYLTDSAYIAGLEDQFKLNIVQFTKADITIDGASTARCANVASAITTLTSIVTVAVTNDNLNHATKTVPTGTLTTNDHLGVFHDGNKFWTISEVGSTSYVHSSTDRGRTWKEEYTANAVPGLRTLGFSYDIIVGLGANGRDVVFDGTASEIDSSISNSTPVFQDNTISNTYDSNRSFACDNVASSIFTLWNIVIDRINGRTVPDTEFATSVFNDSNNRFFNVGHSFDDLPIIEVSPYIFNASVISFLGGNGCEIDGAKVATPNVKRPGLPPQGKSMVAAAFTIISFGGTGYNVFNDGYTQLVSVFCIFTQDGALVESGGYASLTNSASNFGTFALRSSGVRDEAYTFHKGIVDNITFNDVGVPVIKVTGLGEAPLEHFIIEPTGFELAPQPGQNPKYFIEETESATPTAPITAEVRANKTMSVRGNFNRYTDAADQLERNARYIAEEAYFSAIAVSSNSFDQNRNKCIRDTEEIIKAWAKDIRFDANDATWDAAKLYTNGTSIQHVAGYEAATKEVIDYATNLAKKAINNLLQIKGSTAQTSDYYVAQWTDEIPYVDNTITHDLSSAGGLYISADCTNVQNAIQTLSDLFDEIIDNPTVNDPLPSTATRTDGFFTINEFNKDKLQDHPIDFVRPSICNSSSHTWEFSGSGNDYNALPQNGGTRGSSETGDFEQVSQLNGRVYASGTDELGDFKIGYFANVENRTGNITFGGTVEISEVSFLKISGADTTIEGFGTEVNLNAIELGGVAPGPSDSILPTQRAVYQYINNQLGIYIGRTYSTTPTPSALVQLDNSGRINIDQLPALRPFNIFTVVDEPARLAFEGPLAGDIVIQTATATFNFTSADIDTATDEFTITGHGLNTSDAVTYNEGSGVVTAPSPLVDGTTYYAIVVDADTIKLANSITDASTNSPINITNAGSGNHIFETQGTPISFILNNDLESQILEFVPDALHSFSNGDITLASPGGGQGQVTNFLEGTVKQVIVNSGGSGYANGDTVTFTAPTGGNAAVGTLVVNGGTVTAVNLSSGGDNYFTAPSTAGGTISITSSGGNGATLTTIIRSRLSINIINSIKTTTSDTVDDTATPTPNTITLANVVNTSGFSADNWIQLTSSTIDASFITSGIINPTRLAAVTAQNPASSLTYLRGDSLFAPAVASLKIGDESPVVLGSNNSTSTYISSLEMEDAGVGYTTGTYTDTNLLGGNGQNLKGTLKISNGVVRSLTITNGGTGYTEEPKVTFKDFFTDPQNPTIITGINARAHISGGQVVKITLLDGGSGLGTNVPTVEITGGNGVDAAATAVVADGAIQYIQITDGGVNYTPTVGNTFFQISPNPPIIGISPTNAATIEAYFATVPKLFNDITIDINRVNGNTPNANSYSTIGVAKFRKSDTGSGVRTGQFIIGADGAIDIDQGQGSGFDADLLDNQDSNFYVECDNFVPGSSPTPGLPSNCLIGTYGIDIDGTSNFAEVATAKDARTSTFQPSNFIAGGHLQWKNNASNPGYANTWEYLQDGGQYHSVLTYRRGGTGSTFAEGATTQLGFTDNNNLFIRNSGANQVNSLTITTGGSGYVDGVYNNVPLGGGDGFGLKANLTVVNGSFTSVELTDKGFGYNSDGSAGSTFNVILPFSFFGTQNTRQITTPAVITATLPIFQNNAGQDIWSSWQKIWHSGNDGKNSGLDADLMNGNNLRWMQKALNLSESEQLMNSKMPRQMADHSFNEEIRITAPDPQYLINAGDVFDIYIEGYNLTQEQIESLDTQTIGALGVGTQLNLYTANDISEGTATLINRKINLDPSNRETGLQYVEQNYEWTANATFQKNDRIVYGHNVYIVSNPSSGGYTTGTVPPVHGSGTVTATGGTAQFQFERKVSNPYTLLTVEITSGNLSTSIKKIGILDAPAELYPVTDFAQSSDETYSLSKARLGFTAGGDPFLELGNNTQTTSPKIEFKSSGNGVFDAKISITGGSSTAGTGDMDFDVNTASINGNIIWHAGNLGVSTGIGNSNIYDTNSNGDAVLRTASGDFASRFIYATGIPGGDEVGFKGTASGNLALSGGTMTGNITFNQDEGGIVFSRNTDGASILFFNDSDSDTNSRLEFNINDNGNEFFRWTGTQGGTVREFMRLTPATSDYNGRLNFRGIATIEGNHTGGDPYAQLVVKGRGTGATSYTGIFIDNPDGKQAHLRFGENGTVKCQIRWQNGTTVDNKLKVYSYLINQDFITFDAANGNMGIGTTNPDTNYKLDVNGALAATSKSFVIDHPTKEGYKLRYGSLEGPEHGVYVRGKANEVIELPDYWTELVHEDSITVQLTPIGNHNSWVEKIEDNRVYIGGGDCFYFVQAERKDVDKIVVEYPTK
jgi:hypothetical protein|tara:strand:- start:7259 stop:17683 length:10425 start_codon:yes stop_codon:yes gene_type:complete